MISCLMAATSKAVVTAGGYHSHGVEDQQKVVSCSTTAAAAVVTSQVSAANPAGEWLPPAVSGERCEQSGQYECQFQPLTQPVGE